MPLIFIWVQNLDQERQKGPLQSDWNEYAKEGKIGKVRSVESKRYFILVYREGGYEAWNQKGTSFWSIGREGGIGREVIMVWAIWWQGVVLSVFVQGSISRK